VADFVSGQLLIAAPQLGDYFRRTVVLVVAHTEEGAMGLVLNRPTETTVAEAVPRLSDLTEEDAVVYSGGPVGVDSVVALGDFEEPEDAGTPVIGPLGLLDPDRDEVGLRRLRVYAGHAGWAPGQLDDELAQDAWIVESVQTDDPFREGDLWAEVLQRKGGAYTLLATMPAHPSLN
jgi:putative transcriptional regulator